MALSHLTVGFDDLPKLAFKVKFELKVVKNLFSWHRLLMEIKKIYST